MLFRSTYTFTPALVTGDSFTGALTRVAGENVGTYAIGQGDLALSANYTLTYTSANLTIGQKTITVTAEAKSKTYGDTDPVLTYTYESALVTGDSFTGALTRATGENVGTYAITQGDLALSTNYTLTYTGANLTIGQKTITVTAEAKSKVYGEADPVLTYTFTPALVTGDSFTGALTRVAGENVGTYAITQGDLALSTNYTLTYTGDDLTISKKTITVTAEAKSKTYGDADPELTYTFTPALVTGDSFTGALARVAGEDVGTYAITQGDLALSANYTISYVPASLTISKATITGISFPDGTFVYDGTVKSLSISGVSPTGTTMSYTDNGRTDAGTQTVTATINGGNNYQDLILTATLTITKATVTGITLPNDTFVYDGTAKSLAITGTLPTSTSLSYQGNAQTNAGTYTVTATINGGNNYQDLVLTATLTITKATVTGITFPNGTFVYDGTAKSLAITGTLPTSTSLSYQGNAQTNAGTYTVTATINGGTNYQDLVLNATLTITSLLTATDDSYSAEWSHTESGTTGSVLANDRINHQSATLSQVTLTPGVSGSPLLSMNADGTIVIGVGVRPGVYSYPYTICETANPTNCSSATATINITAAEIFVSNVITPNGDGKNDYFEVVGLESYDSVDLSVFTPSGFEVYRKDRYDNSWGGASLDEGTYFYTLRLRKNGQETVKKGYILIKRN